LASLLDEQLPRLYRDKLSVGLTRIYNTDKYLDVITDKFFLAEALCHLKRLGEAEQLIKRRRTVRREAYRSALISYALLNRTDKANRLIDEMCTNLGRSRAIDEIFYVVIYSGVDNLLRPLIKLTEGIESNTFLPVTSHEKPPRSILNILDRFIKDYLTAHTLSTIILLRINSPLQSIIELVKNEIKKTPLAVIKAVYYSTLILYLKSRGKEVEYYKNELKEFLKDKSILFGSPPLMITFINLLAADELDVAYKYLRQILPVLIFPSKLHGYLDYLSPPQVKNIFYAEKASEKLVELALEKRRVIENFLAFAFDLENYMISQGQKHVWKIEEIVAIGYLLTRDIKFLQLLVMAWVRQGFHDLAEEALGDALMSIQDKNVRYDFIQILGIIYADPCSGKLRDFIENILQRATMREKKAFIDTMYVDTARIYRIQL